MTATAARPRFGASNAVAAASASESAPPESATTTVDPAGTAVEGTPHRAPHLGDGGIEARAVGHRSTVPTPGPTQLLLRGRQMLEIGAARSIRRSSCTRERAPSRRAAHSAPADPRLGLSRHLC